MKLLKSFSIPQYFKSNPLDLPIQRVFENNIKIHSKNEDDGLVPFISNGAINYKFLSLIRYYGGMSGGVGINPSSYTTLFNIENIAFGGYIPLIVLPAIKSAGKIKFTIDSQVIEIEIRTYAIGERLVFGHSNYQAYLSEETSCYTLDGSLVIKNPLEYMNSKLPGLYFRNNLKLEFLGDVIHTKYLPISFFTMVKLK